MSAEVTDPAGHLSAERLAAAALISLESDPGSPATNADDPDETAGLTEDERAHVAGCAVCRYEFDAIRRVRDLSDDGDRELSGLRQPDPALWDRILAAVDGPGALAPAAQVGRSPQTPSPPVASPDAAPVRSSDPMRADTSGTRAGAPRRRRSRLLVALVAAAVGLGLGVGGTVIVRRVSDPPPVVLARTSLQALPGEQGTGSAELVRSGDVLDLQVRVDAAATPNRFYQLWLIDTAGDKMYDLGTLPPTGTASYPVPAELAQGLGTYTTVDVSIEPYDGDPAHSRHSLVRGQLPT